MKSNLSYRRSPRPGFTLVELLVVIAIVIILLALLVPTVGSALARRGSTQCADHLREIGLALRLASDQSQAISPDDWTTTILPFVGNQSRVLRCPEATVTPFPSDYGMNKRAHRFRDEDGGRIVALDYSKTVADLVVESLDDQDDWIDGEGGYAARHLGRFNALLYSGAVKEYEPTDVDPQDCELWKRYWRPYRDRFIVLQSCEGASDPPPLETPDEDEEVEPSEPKYPPYDGVSCVRVKPQVIDDQDTEGFRLEKDDTPDIYINAFGLNIYQGSSEWKRIGGENPANGHIWSHRMYENYHTLAPGHQTDGTRAVYEFEVEPGNRYKVYAFWLGEDGQWVDEPLGVTVDLDENYPALGLTYDFIPGQGVVVRNVANGSDARAQGISGGSARPDRIIEIDGWDMTDPSMTAAQVEELLEGSPISRNSQLTVTEAVPDSGVTAFTMDERGVYATAVTPGSPADVARIRIRVGDHVTQIRGQSTVGWSPDEVREGLSIDDHVLQHPDPNQRRQVINFEVTKPPTEVRMRLIRKVQSSTTYNPLGGSAADYPSYGHSDRTPIRIFDGPVEEGRLVGEQRVNQKFRAEGASFSTPTPSGLVWQDWAPIGEYDITSDTLTVTISADANAPNDYGQAGDYNVVADAVRVECAESSLWPHYPDECSSSQYSPIDNDDSEYSETGSWSTDSDGGAMGSGQRVASAGNGEATATFEFSDVVGGQYTVWTHFVAKPGQASNTPVNVYDGSHQFGTVLLNQSVKYVGADLDGDGKIWYRVGDYEMRERDVVRVVFSNAANGPVVADAVRIECAQSATETTSTTSYEDCDNVNQIYGRECRRQYAEDYGANAETEEAVQNSLGWLSRHQYEDGSWSYDHANATCPHIEFPEPCEGQCQNGGGKGSYRVAATGMALLPFLGAGIGPSHSDYGKVVAKGINFLIDHVNESGRLSMGNAQLNYEGYEQGIGTLALVEALGICRATGFGSIEGFGGTIDEDYRVDEAELTSTVQLAIFRIVTCQDPDTGGWQYGCRTGQDMTVTGWMVQALVAANAMGIDYESFAEEERQVMGRILDYLSRNSSEWVTDPNGYGDYGKKYWYQRWWNPWENGSQIGKFLRLTTGAAPQSAGMQAAADDELTRMASGEGNMALGVSAYRAYYTHHFMRRMGGHHWEEWDAAMQAYLLEENPQFTSGHERGSWVRGASIHGQCGRLWDTASAALCFEAYYRYAKSL
ncbi:MAG: prepilin-type N-terminal cleavage/methylation domain-containing protein [Planctomycetota bacterium]|nr:MAG: prepilin-type N-terminal cleavage/methylation domain-containing protein [Planctomycetota bacterium]REK49090.1 MAG: prepilin-type N-terminal cleavage/methylation domain-containing protein [Planctomycetota bacterium]